MVFLIKILIFLHLFSPKIVSGLLQSIPSLSDVIGTPCECEFGNLYLDIALIIDNSKRMSAQDLNDVIFFNSEEKQWKVSENDVKLKRLGVLEWL